MGSSAFVSGCSVYIGVGCLIVVAKSRSFSVGVDKSLSVAVDDVMTHQIADFCVQNVVAIGCQSQQYCVFLHSKYYQYNRHIS